jgi:hypothetical protein
VSMLWTVALCAAGWFVGSWCGARIGDWLVLRLGLAQRGEELAARYRRWMDR